MDIEQLIELLMNKKDISGVSDYMDGYRDGCVNAYERVLEYLKGIS